MDTEQRDFEISRIRVQLAECLEQIRAIDKQVFELAKLRQEHMQRLSALREQALRMDKED